MATCTLIQELVSENTDFDKDHDLLSIDTYYYPGVPEAIKKHLKKYPSRKALVIFNAYISKPGSYLLDNDEGEFRIWEEAGVKMVEM